MLVALVEQVKILAAQRRQEAVRIEELADLAVGIRSPQLITEKALPLGDHALEDPLWRQERHGMGRRFRRIELDHLAGGRAAQERPGYETRRPSVSDRMHPQDGMRRGVLSLEERGQVGLGKNHALRGLRVTWARSGTASSPDTAELSRRPRNPPRTIVTARLLAPGPATLLHP